MLVSFTGTGISHAVLATYIYLSATTDINLDAFEWVPLVSFSAMIFIASCGALPIPYLIAAEILPDKVGFCVHIWIRTLDNIYFFDNSIIPDS